MLDTAIAALKTPVEGNDVEKEKAAAAILIKPPRLKKFA